ncbi:sodium:calcium antiporter [Ectothiorhodospiraceae bacterium WFHF3C12]|nr:sodium:calcium antiporter [Ectothiorhodospiraceae bacterium WFHF3C12]
MLTSQLPASIGVFLIAAAVIAFLGVRLSSFADRLADVTGFGEAFVGAVILGGVTSLPGIVAVVTSASDGYPAMAFSTAVGGIVAQTAFLALADLTYRDTNLEHAAASVPNMLAGALLMSLLALLLVTIHGPEFSILGIHPATVVLVIAYVTGMRLVYRAHERPMWQPRITRATRVDKPDEGTVRRGRLSVLLPQFVFTALSVAVAGWALSKSGEVIAAETGLTDSFVGGVLVAVSTSLPELVTALAAVRIGALTLAVSGIIGGNAFDTLFAAVGDIAYRDGSIYHAVTAREPALLSLALLMTGVLLLGMLHRERQGFANIGFESALLLLLYLGGVAYLGLS